MPNHRIAHDIQVADFVECVCVCVYVGVSVVSKQCTDVKTEG